MSGQTARGKSRCVRKSSLWSQQSPKIRSTIKVSKSELVKSCDTRQGTVRRIMNQRVEKVIHDGLFGDFGLEREKNHAYRGTLRYFLSVSGSPITAVMLRDQIMQMRALLDAV